MKRKPFGLEEHGPLRFNNRHRLPGDPDFDARRLAAVDLRHQGFSNQVIGRKLHADPSWNTDRDYPNGVIGGYGWKNYRQGKPPLRDNALELAVSRDISPAARRARLALETTRQEGLALHIERLNMAAAAIWGGVMRGNARDHEVWLRNMQEQASLMGWYPAAGVDVTVSGSIGIAEGPQPVFDVEFATKMFDALREIGAILPGDPDPLAALLPTTEEKEPAAIEAASTEAT